MIKNKKIKKEMITCTVMIIGMTALTACGKSELLKMLENGTQIEIEVAEPDFAQEEQGTESSIEWTELALLTTNDTLRTGWDNTLKILKLEEGKNGVLFVNQNGQHENNNTLSVAIHNRGFQKIFEDEDTLESLASSVTEQYADLEASPDKNDILKQVYIGINGYFNLLADNQMDYANPDSTLTRADFLAMVFRADTPVKELESDGLTNSVGKNDLNIYAQGAVKDSYLDTESKSLNNMTYNGSTTRAEAIYTLVSRYFSDELSTVDTKDNKFTDAKDGGDIASQQNFDTTKDYWKSYELTYALQNPDKGLPTDLYNALCVAQEKGFIGEETRWDEAITKAEAIELLCKALIADDSIPTFDYAQGEITGNEVEDDTQQQSADEVENEGGVDVPTEDGEYSEFDNEEYADDGTGTDTGTVDEIESYEEVVAGLKANYENGLITKEEYEECLEDAKYLIPGYTDSSSANANTQQKQPPQTQVPDEYANAPLEQDTGAVAPDLSEAKGDYSGYHVY